MTERGADQLHQDNAPAHSTALVQAFLGAKNHIIQVCQPPTAHIWLSAIPAFPKAKISIKREICECDRHTVHKLSQRHLTAEWLAPRESDCSRMHSKVSSDWLPSYVKATQPVLEIYKKDGYFLDSPH